MDPFSPIINFFTDGSKRLSSKALLAVSIVFILLMADNIFGFSYYRNNEKKISQIKEINEILNDSSYSPFIKNNMKELQEQILKRKNIKEHTTSFLSKFPWFRVKKNIEGKNIKNPYWQYFSSSWFLIILILALPVHFFMDEKLSWARALLISVVSIILVFALSVLWANLLSYIPNIFDKPWINYILNAILQAVIVGILSEYGSQSKKNSLI